RTQGASYAMNMLRGLPIGNIDKRINTKMALKQLISTLVGIQKFGSSPQLLDELKEALSNPNIHSMGQIEARPPNLIYMDQINFFVPASGALEYIAFISY